MSCVPINVKIKRKAKEINKRIRAHTHDSVARHIDACLDHMSLYMICIFNYHVHKTKCFVCIDVFVSILMHSDFKDQRQ